MPDSTRTAPTLLDYARVIEWLWTERHNIRPDRQSGVHMSDFPPGLGDVFEDALNRVALKRQYEAEIKRLEGGAP